MPGLSGVQTIKNKRVLDGWHLRWQVRLSGNDTVDAPEPQISAWVVGEAESAFASRRDERA